MRFILSYLWRSSLIRLSTIWIFLALFGISIFSWKIITAKAELLEVNKQLDSYIEAIQQLESDNADEKKDEIDTILEEIDNFRPNVDALLDFVKVVEDTASELKLFIDFYTVNTGVSSSLREEDHVNYKIELSATLQEVEIFLEKFENLPYATRIKSIDIREREEANYNMQIIFILYSQL